MSQKKKELFTRSYRFRNRGTGPQSEQNISYNNHRVSVNYEGIDFDTLPENELLKISAQISSELEENSKGENSANNHVNTNFSILQIGDKYIFHRILSRPSIIVLANVKRLSKTSIRFRTM
jgi:hypothetical protein